PEPWKETAMKWIIVAAATTLTASAFAQPATDRLVNWKGMTLYIYDRDSATRSACDEQCTVEWPPMHAAANSEGTEGWTVINRDDGTKQWAYKGRPLYTS